MNCFCWEGMVPTGLGHQFAETAFNMSVLSHLRASQSGGPLKKKGTNTHMCFFLSAMWHPGVIRITPESLVGRCIDILNDSRNCPSTSIIFGAPTQAPCSNGTVPPRSSYIDFRCWLEVSELPWRSGSEASQLKLCILLSPSHGLDALLLWLRSGFAGGSLFARDVKSPETPVLFSTGEVRMGPIQTVPVKMGEIQRSHFYVL